MGPGRVELPTLPLSGARSSQLSYGPSRFSGGLRLSGLSGDDALTASLSKPPTLRQPKRCDSTAHLAQTPTQAMYPATIRCFQRTLPLAGRGLSKPNSSAGGGKKVSSARSATTGIIPCGTPNRRIDLEWMRPRTAPTTLVRKEVIQPQVPLRLPCYDFAPVTGHTMGGYLPCGLVCRLPVQQTSMA